MSTVPARIHVILARRADTAVVIRRGPTKAVCTVAWDRAKDRFWLGQWFRGRLFERRSDLSPDGKHFIYFAFKGRWKSPTRGSWTAISRAPYLKAVGLWANGGAWNGGGLFLDDRTYWLNAFPFGHDPQRIPSGLRAHDEFPFHERYGGECPGVYYVRLQRDGWHLLRYVRDSAASATTVFQKPLLKGWLLEKYAHETQDHPVGRGCYFDTHRLLHLERGVVDERPGWEWAELDRNRVVWAEGGMLYAAPIHAAGLGAPRLLHDFNGMEFERTVAPY